MTGTDDASSEGNAAAIRDRLQFSGPVASSAALEAMKDAAVYFFELDDYLDQYGISRSTGDSG